MNLHDYIKKIHQVNPLNDSILSAFQKSIPVINAINPSLEIIKLAGLPTNDYSWIKQIHNLHKVYQPITELVAINSLSSSVITQFNNFNTNWFKDITDLRGLEYNLEELIDEEEGEEDVKKSQIIELADNTKQIIKSVYEDNKLITKVDPREFEKVIAELLRKKGYDVELTKRTRDGGFDVIALTKLGGIPFKLLAECKRHNDTIGVDIIRSFCDVISDQKVNKGIIFATSYFSKPAKDRKSRMGSLLDLQDKDDIIEWIIDYHKN